MGTGTGTGTDIGMGTTKIIAPDSLRAEREEACLTGATVVVATDSPAFTACLTAWKDDFQALVAFLGAHGGCYPRPCESGGDANTRSCPPASDEARDSESRIAAWAGV